MISTVREDRGVYSLQEDNEFRDMQPRTFTKDMWDTFVAMAKAGHGPKELGDAVGLGKTTAFYHLNRLISKGLEVNKVTNATGKKKLSDRDLVDIRRRIANGETQAAIAKDYGVNKSQITRRLKR